MASPGNIGAGRSSFGSPQEEALAGQVLPSVEFTFSCRLTPEPQQRPAVPCTPRATNSTARNASQKMHFGNDANKGQNGLSLFSNVTSSTYADQYDATPSPKARLGLEYRPQSSPTPSLTARLHDLGFQDSEDGQAEDWNRNDSASNSSPVEDDEREWSESDLNDEGHDNYFYSIRQERHPQVRIYNTHLQNALRDVRSHLKNLTNTMRGCPLVHDQTTGLYDLYQKVQTMSQFQYPETRTVGFIGNSGVGKSALINSLLDREGLARSSGDGAACTCVVTEFRNVDDNHQNPFTIEVDFMNTDEVKELLEELLRCFRLYYTKEYRQVRDEEERERIEKSSTRAWKTLKSIFPNQPCLSHDFLSGDADGAESRILRTLEEWANAGAIHRPGGPGVLQYSVTASHLDKCKEHLDMLTTDHPDKNRPAIWPFIKLIRVYLRSPILRTGLVVADLPGFQDLNFARVRATERYLRYNCDEVFIVGTIIRCTTGQSIEDIIQRCDPNQPQRIVCTRSEDVTPDETARSSPPEVAKHIRQLVRRTQELKKRIVSTTSLRRERTGAQSEKLAVEEGRLRDEKEILDLGLSRFLIEKRNRRVIESLAEKYNDTTRVFCVSNKLYSDYREDSRERAEAYIELSGIPELRRYCQSVPAEAQFRAAAAFLEHRVPTLLGSLNQWALVGSDSVTAESAATLSRVVNRVKGILRDPNSPLLRSRLLEFNLNRQFDISIRRTISSRQGRWTTGAVKTSKEWAAWHHSTYAAFCRHYGTHKTANQLYRCWNDEILQEAREELQPKWDGIVDWIQEQTAVLREATANAFQSVCKLLHENTHLAPQALKNLLANMKFWERCIMNIVHGSLEKLIQSIQRTNRDALHGHDNSYVAALMRPAYKACIAESGTGSDARRKGIMHQHLSNSSLFSDLSKTITARYQEIVTETSNDLQQKIQGEINNIAKDLQAVEAAVDGEVTEAKKFPEFTDELRVEVNEVQMILGRAGKIVKQLSEE